MGFFKNKVVMTTFLIALLGVYILRTFGFQILQVQGNSMHPTLKHGNLVIVHKWKFPNDFGIFSKGIVYTKPEIEKLGIYVWKNQEGKLIAKRAVGLPGDFYEFQEGTVVINKKPIQEEYISRGQKTEAPKDSQEFEDLGDFLPIGKSGRIPPGYFLLLGDNREFSDDSRTYGLVPLFNLRGKLIYTLPW